MTTSTFSPGSILSTPLSLSRIRRTVLHIPLNLYGNICLPAYYVRTKSYQLTGKKVEFDSPGFADIEECIQATIHGILHCKEEGKYYSLFSAINNIKGADVKALMTGARRTPWEDVLVKSS